MPEWIVQLGPLAGTVVIAGMFLGYLKSRDALNREVHRETNAVIAQTNEVLGGVKTLLLRINGSDAK